MAIPLRQNLKIGAYLLRQKLAGREKFPLIVELEPLFACNLACPGCGKIQYPTEVLRQRVSVEDALAAMEECGAPMVSIPQKRGEIRWPTRRHEPSPSWRPRRRRAAG